MKRKNAVPPCAPEVESKGSLGPRQKESSVFISYRAKRQQIIALRAQTLLAVSGITCRVRFPSQPHEASVREDILIRFDDNQCSCAWSEGHDAAARVARNLVLALIELDAFERGKHPLSGSKTPIRKRIHGSQGGPK